MFLRRFSIGNWLLLIVIRLNIWCDNILSGYMLAIPLGPSNREEVGLGV